MERQGSNPDKIMQIAAAEFRKVLSGVERGIAEEEASDGECGG